MDRGQRTADKEPNGQRTVDGQLDNRTEGHPLAWPAEFNFNLFLQRVGWGTMGAVAVGMAMIELCY